ncbi:MAG: DUF2442 domain-containing protein [Haliscomenobacter sp.]|nr:DUF2442 domain-containing protein [Haliscomenobacter sp.]
MRIVGVHCYRDGFTTHCAQQQEGTKTQNKCFPRLLTATPQQLQNLQLLGDGIAIHWPDVDEDLSLKGFLKGSFLNALEA